MLAFYVAQVLSMHILNLYACSISLGIYYFTIIFMLRIKFLKLVASQQYISQLQKLLSIMTFRKATLSITTFSITTFSITTFSITTFSITTFSITTFRIMTLSITTSSTTTLSIALNIMLHLA